MASPPPPRPGEPDDRLVGRVLTGGAVLAALAGVAALAWAAAWERPVPAALGAVLLVLSAVLGAGAAAHRRALAGGAMRERELIATVSHEMRTPLAQIRMLAQTLLLGRERDDEERRRWLAVIDREAARLAEYVDNSTLFARLEHTEVYLLRRPVELGGLLTAVAAACASRADARAMRIVVDAPECVYAEVDADAVRQLLLNLVDNAVRFGTPGQTVRVSLEAGAEGAVLAVDDAGPGVPRAARERIWEPFVRLDAADVGDDPGGSGLGLAVARRVAAAHGGRVFVGDSAGGGARFGVVLPVASAERKVEPSPHRVTVPLA